MLAYIESHPVGGAISCIECRVGEHTVRGVDLSVFFGARWSQIDKYKTPVPYVPDIAVKVLSEFDRQIELNRKISDYLSTGSQEVWVIDPEGEIEIRTEGSGRILAGADTLETPLLPGFSVAVDELLA